MAEKAHRTLEAYTWPQVRGQWLDVYDSVRPGRAPQTAAVRA